MSKTRIKNRDEGGRKEIRGRGLEALGREEVRKKIFEEQKLEPKVEINKIEINKRVAEMKEKVSEILADIKEKKLESLIGRLQGQTEEAGLDILSLGEQVAKSKDSELEEMREKVSAFAEIVKILEKEYKIFVERIEQARSNQMEETPEDKSTDAEPVQTDIGKIPADVDEAVPEATVKIAEPAMPVEKEVEVVSPLVETQIKKEETKESGGTEQDPEEYIKKKFEKAGIPKGEKAIPWVIGEIIGDIKKSKFLDLYDKEQIRPKLRSLREIEYKNREDFIKQAVAVVKEIDEIFKQNKFGNINPARPLDNIQETAPINEVKDAAEVQTSEALVEKVEPVASEQSEPDIAEERLAPEIPALDLDEPDLPSPPEPEIKSKDWEKLANVLAGLAENFKEVKEKAKSEKLKKEAEECLTEVEGLQTDFVFIDTDDKQKGDDFEEKVSKLQDKAMRMVTASLEESELAEEETSPAEMEERLVPPELILEDNVEKLKIILEEKRKAYAEAKKKFKKGKKLTARVGRFFSRKKALNAETDLSAIEQEYAKAKAEYVNAGIALAMEEQADSADARILRDVKVGEIAGAVWSDVRGIYKKLGDWNLEAVMENKPKSWLGKVGMRMLSVRTAINAGLVGVGYLTGARVATGAVRAGMRFVGTAGLTYDLLQNAARAKEEKKGLLADLTDEEIERLSPEDAIQRVDIIRAVSVLDGVDLEQSKYRGLYDRLVERIGEVYYEEGSEAVEFSEEEKIQAWDKFFVKYGGDLDKKIKELKKIKGRHRLFAIGAGVVSASGLLGQVIGNVLEKTGVTDVVKGWFGHTQAHDGGAPAEVEPADEGTLVPILHRDEIPTSVGMAAPLAAEVSVPAEEMAPKIDLANLSPSEIRNQLEASLGYDPTVGKGEGVTHVLQRAVDHNPRVLENYTDIKDVQKMLEKHNGNFEELTRAERHRAAWLIEKHDFKQEVLVKGPDNNVVALFDESEGRFKIGTLDKSNVNNRLYGQLEVGVEKMPTQIETVDESGNISPEKIPYDGSIKQYEEMNFAPEKGIETIKRIIVPVDLPSGSTIGGLNELNEVVARAAGQTAVEAAPPLNAASELINSYGEISAAPDTVATPVEEVVPKAVEISADDIAQAQAEYKNAWLGYSEKMNKVLNSEKVIPYDFQSGANKTNRFISEVWSKLNETSNLDVNNPDLVAALSKGSQFSEAQMVEVVEDDIISKLPKEAQLLLTEFQPNDPQQVLTLGDGSSAVKFLDKSSGETSFIYDPDYVFTGNKDGDLVATKGGIDYIIKPPFFKNGKLDLTLESVNK